MPDDPLAPQHTPPPSASPLATPPGMPPAVGATSTGLAPNIAAGIAVLFAPLSSIVFLVIEKRSQFVRFWAMQAAIYGLIWVAARIFLEIFARLFISTLSMAHLVDTLWTVFNLAYLVGLVIMLYFAFTSKEWEFPGIGKFARQQLVKFPPQP